MANKKKWSELSSGAKALVVLAAIAELVLTTVALKDLRSRTRDELRGPKWLWRLVSFVQPVGPIAYLVLGRRARD
jgi:hypothetical protein